MPAAFSLALFSSSNWSSRVNMSYYHSRDIASIIIIRTEFRKNNQ